MSSFNADEAVRFRVVLIDDDEDLLRRRALSALMQAAKIGPEDFDYQTFTADSAHPSEWIGSVGTTPFMSSKRVIVVRNLNRRDPAEVPKGSLGTLPETALLVLVMDEEISESPSGKSHRSAWRSLMKQAGAYIGLEKKGSDRDSYRAEVTAEFEQRGKKIARQAVEALLDMCGWSLGRALEEAEKIILYSGEKMSIEERDIRAVVVPVADWNVFRMVDALLDGRLDVAFQHLRPLLSSTKRPAEAAHGQVLPAVVRQLRFAYQARVLLEQKGKIEDPSQEVRSWLPQRHNLLATQAFQRRAAVQLATRTRLDRIAFCLTIVADAESKTKGALPGFGPGETMEWMLLEMGKVLAPGKR